MKKKCKFCNIEFEVKRKNAKYCSKRCREKAWIQNNPERDKVLKKKWRDKQDILCRWCQNPIPQSERKSGVTYCSEKCRKESRLAQDKNLRKKAFDAFGDFKKQLGCQNCGYHRCAGSLDFHHVVEHEKERRITAKMWYGQSNLIKQELDKCVLLCKNCHYEVHNSLIEITGKPKKWKINVIT